MAVMTVLKPFWIYWAALVSGCIVFFICPLLFIIFLPVLFVIIPVWIIIVYLIGSALQRRGELDKISKRIGLAFLCSFLTVMIFPVCSWIYDIMKWGGFKIASFINNFKDPSFWAVFGVHFLVLWIGEEVNAWLSQ